MSIKQHNTGLTKANNFVWLNAVGLPDCKVHEEGTSSCSALDPWCLEEGLEHSRLNKYVLLVEPENRDA